MAKVKSNRSKIKDAECPKRVAFFPTILTAGKGAPGWITTLLICLLISCSLVAA